MKDPLISIKSSDLKRILEEEFGKINVFKFKNLQKKLYKSRSINRMTVFANTAQSRKVAKTLRLATTNTERFNRIFHTTRINLEHKNIRVITKDSKSYESLKIATSIADDFIKTFEIDSVDQGYELFIQIIFDVMGKKFGINKIQYYKDSIYDEFESRILIREDNNKDGTQLLFDSYVHKMLEATTVEYKISKASDHTHFIYARMEADDHKANYEDWIDGQFDGLAFMNVVPEPNQLYGPKSYERYNKYTRRKQKTLATNSKPVEDMDEGTREYLQRLREKRLLKS